MQKILAAIRAVMAAIKTVWEPVFEAGAWTMRAVTKYVAAPVIGAADAVIDAGLSLPGRILGGLRASGTGTGKAAQSAAQQTDADVRAAQQANEAVLTNAQTARILQKVAKWRTEDKPVESLLEALPAPLQSYVRGLTIAECVRLADTDARAVADWLGGTRGPLPGVRTPDEVIADRQPKVAQPAATNGRVPAPGVAETPDQSAILDTLSARILARTNRTSDDKVIWMDRRSA